MITFQLESWDQYYADCQDLWKEHYEEIAADKDKMPHVPDIEAFKLLSDKGFLQIMTVRDDGIMVAYMITMIRVHFHYSKTLCAFEDAYFMTKNYRKGLFGVRFIKEALKFLKGAGVQKVFFHTKAWKNLGRIYERLGFTNCDLIYSKWIG